MTLSLEASNDSEHEDANVAKQGGRRILKSAVLYGANASGKSNLIAALSFMRSFTLTSSREGQAAEPIRVQPFQLSTESDRKPSSFEIIFIKNGERYRYGFEADTAQIHSEWLFLTTSSRESELFTREKRNIKVNSERFKEAKSGLVDLTRPNALFLSVVAQFNGEISGAVLQWFGDVRFIHSTRNPRLAFTAERMSNPQFAKRVLEMAKLADLAIEGVAPKPDETEEELPGIGEGKRTARYATVEIKTQHKKFDAENQLTGLVEFDLEKHESEGTKKYFSMTGPILDSLENGRILIADELDARLHPLLSRAIVSMFNNQENKHGSQLIFATHDTNLLNKKFFRRDQVWFTEKDQYGSSNLYSLAEFKVRKDASFGKDYILGKFGAVPCIGDLKSIFGDEGLGESI